MLDLILADGTVHEHQGAVVSFDAAVDPRTGTLTLEADFPNPARRKTRACGPNFSHIRWDG